MTGSEESSASREASSSAKDAEFWDTLQDAWAAARRHGSEIGHLAADHVGIQADRVRLRLRRAAIRAGLLFLLVTTLVVALAAAVVQTISGVTGALGALFGTSWLGQLVGGILLLAAIAAAIAVALRIRSARHSRRVMSKHGVPRTDAPMGAVPGTPPMPEGVGDEATYLRQRAAASRAELGAASRALGEDLVSMIDARRVVRAHPWWSVGTSASTGFVFGRAFVRRRHKLPRSIAAMLFAMPVRRLFVLVLRALSRPGTGPASDKTAHSASNGGPGEP